MAEARRILVVEDEEPVRGLVVGHLERLGYEVAQASDAEQVLLRMSRDRTPFDVVLSDIHLPGLSGVELLRLLLTHSPLRPVILITGDADEALARTALGHGATGYLLKPFQLFELEAVVRQAVSRLQLVEAASSLAGLDGPGGGRQRPGEAPVPAAWLDLADRRSSAGSGHGYRVARIAGALASVRTVDLAAEDRVALDVAARAHELGRLLGPAVGQGELASRTAQLLYDLGVESRVLRIMNQLRECWHRTAGPDVIDCSDLALAARIVAVADAVDHAAIERLAAGVDPSRSIADAFAGVRQDADRRYGAEIAGAMDAGARVAEAIWVLARGPVDGPPVAA
jgi:CheY-like chemotaxis protein